MLPVPFMHIPVDSKPAGGSGFAGPWFMSPTMEDELEARDLSAEDAQLVKDYARDGFLVLDDLGLDDFDSLAGRVAESLGPLHEGGAYNRVSDAWESNADVRAIATAPKIIRILQLLYGRRPIPFQTLN